MVGCHECRFGGVRRVPTGRHLIHNHSSRGSRADFLSKWCMSSSPSRRPPMCSVPSHPPESRAGVDPGFLTGIGCSPMCQALVRRLQVAITTRLCTICYKQKYKLTCVCDPLIKDSIVFLNVSMSSA